MQYPTELPPTRTVWHYNSAGWEGLWDYISAFPCDANCVSNKNISEAGNDVTEVKQCDMETDIPHIYKIPIPNRKPWFTKEFKSKRTKRKPMPLTNEADIEAPNR